MERTVGPYRILRRIGDPGGMAVVHLAEQSRLGRVVALKELDLQAADPQVVERFIEEARIASSLRHPNIIAVHDFFEENGVPYISMEFAEQGSLRRYVGGLTPAQTFGVLEGVLAGLAHAHAAEVIHRDLKPENLLVSADGAVKIADFGIARALRRATRYTAAGITVGTPAYMAPEQAMALAVTPATDLHSVGVIAYELLSGVLPMTAETPIALMLRKVHESSPDLVSVLPGVDPRLNALIGRLLARVPDDRPQSARETWHELEEIAVALLGPFWRREARLPEPGGVSNTEHPLTPAPFAASAVSFADEPDYVTFMPVGPQAAEEVAQAMEKAAAAEEPVEEGWTAEAEPPARGWVTRDEPPVVEDPPVAEPPPPVQAPPPAVDPWAWPEEDPRVQPTRVPVSAPTVIEKVRPVFPERSWRVWWIAGGVLFVLALAAGGVFAFGGLGGDAAEPVARATPTPSPSPSPTPSPSPSPSATPDPDDAALLTYVTQRVGPTARCEADSGELPSRATARVRCELPGGFPAVYTQFETLKATKAYFKTLRAKGPPQDLGRCAAEGEWFGEDDKVAGQLIGRRDGPQAVLAWSDEAQLVAAFASSARSKRSKLCTSWESYG